MAKGKKEASQQKPERKTPSLEVFLTAVKKARQSISQDGNTTKHHIDYTKLYEDLKSQGYTASRSSVVQRLAKYNVKLKNKKRKYKFVAYRKGGGVESEQAFLTAMDTMFDSNEK
jgi:hypothetical protein